MITVTPLHATSKGGQGIVDYLLDSVTDGVGDPRLATDASRYYAESGTPPGKWFGAGLAALSDETITRGSQVSPQHLRELIAEGKDPGTDAHLGSRFGKPLYKDGYLQDRIDWLDEEHPNLHPEARAARVKQITHEVESMKTRKPVHGFDFTFAPPKSFSTLWGLADPGLREQMANAHHEALQEIIGVLERDIIRTRTGTNGVVQEEVTGVVAAAFDHWDSRAGDPHFHTHLVISNRVQTVSDGKWRTIDSRTVHKSAVALSEQYDSLLMDKVGQQLGLTWALSKKGLTHKNMRWELLGIPPELLKEFSQRNNQVDAAIKAQTTVQFGSKYRKRRLAWRETRTDKQHRSLAELGADWRARAQMLVGERGIKDFRKFVERQARKLSGDLNTDLRSVPMRASDFLPDDLNLLTDEILGNLDASRSTWNHWNIHAEIQRATRRFTLVNNVEREELADTLAAMVKNASVAIDTPTLGYTPERFRRAEDGSSRFQTAYSGVFTSSLILAAEARLTELSQATSGSSIDYEYSFNALNDWRADEGYGLSPDQAVAAHDILTSGRTLDVLVGPAGAGKTTALAGVKDTWEQVYGQGSVIGIAPSAAASSVLAESLGIPTDNLAKWVSTIEFLERKAAADPNFKFPKKWQFQDNQLIIIDEASMSGTRALDFLVTRANAAGAKVLLVGDHAQLSAVGAGGMFAKICKERGKVPELYEVRRFKHEWEKAASMDLRLGRHSAIGAYDNAGRLHSGTQQEVLDQVYDAWLTDTSAGKHSLMIAADNQTARDLSARARDELIQRGIVSPTKVLELRDGNRASAGDVVTTRKNERGLKLVGGDWVKNGDMWNVLKVRKGSLVVEHVETRNVITLPKSYVDEYVELGYAITAHRSQGQTVDTAHAVITETMNREVAYVALTRAKEANHAYLVTDNILDAEHNHGEQGNKYTARELLGQVIQRSQDALTATETREQLAEAQRSFAQLAAEYETLASVADTDRWAHLVATTRPELEAWTQAEEFGALVSQLRAVERTHANTPDALQALLGHVPDEALGSAERGIEHLSRALNHWQANTPATRRTAARKYISGLIPVADTSRFDPEMAKAIEERQALMEQRLAELRTRLAGEQPEWVAKIPKARNEHAHTRRTTAIHAVLAYRDKWGINAPDSVLGQKPDQDFTQRSDYQRVVSLLKGINPKQTARANGSGQIQDPRPEAMQAPERGPEMGL